MSARRKEVVESVGEKSSTVLLRVKKTRYAMVPNGTTQQRVEVPYEGQIFVNSEVKKAGDEFEVTAEQAARFLNLGNVELASDAPTAIKPPHLFKRETGISKFTGFAPIRGSLAGDVDPSLNAEDPNDPNFEDF